MTTSPLSQFRSLLASSEVEDDVGVLPQAYLLHLDNIEQLGSHSLRDFAVVVSVSEQESTGNRQRRLNDDSNTASRGSSRYEAPPPTNVGRESRRSDDRSGLQEMDLCTPVDKPAPRLDPSLFSSKLEAVTTYVSRMAARRRSPGRDHSRERSRHDRRHDTATRRDDDSRRDDSARRSVSSRRDEHPRREEPTRRDEQRRDTTRRDGPTRRDVRDEHSRRDSYHGRGPEASVVNVRDRGSRTEDVRERSNGRDREREKDSRDYSERVLGGRYRAHSPSRFDRDRGRNRHEGDDDWRREASPIDTRSDTFGRESSEREAPSHDHGGRDILRGAGRQNRHRTENDTFETQSTRRQEKCPAHSTSSHPPPLRAKSADETQSRGIPSDTSDAPVSHQESTHTAARNTEQAETVTPNDFTTAVSKYRVAVKTAVNDDWPVSVEKVDTMSTEELLLLDVPKQLDQCSDFVVQKLETAQLGELEVHIARSQVDEIASLVSQLLIHGLGRAVDDEGVTSAVLQHGLSNAIQDGD
eukprot:m.36528 g.36528  ORF g.36528 m.36528 type:complete len:526 (-) comp7585_c1_seq1:1746-3323(-)